jgi:hypothetical protein
VRTCVQERARLAEGPRELEGVRPAGQQLWQVAPKSADEDAWGGWWEKMNMAKKGARRAKANSLNGRRSAPGSYRKATGGSTVAAFASGRIASCSRAQSALAAGPLPISSSTWGAGPSRGGAGCRERLFPHARRQRGHRQPRVPGDRASAPRGAPGRRAGARAGAPCPPPSPTPPPPCLEEVVVAYARQKGALWRYDVPGVVLCQLQLLAYGLVNGVGGWACLGCTNV